MDSKGNAALLRTTKVTEWNVNQSGYLSFLFGGFILLGCVIAYVIAVARGNVEAFLPLISDAAGSPPQNGLFGTLLCIGGMFGVLFMMVRYMIVLEENSKQSKIVTALNRLSICVGILSMLGITLVTGYPVNFYRNREVWLMDVGIPHMIGGAMLFVFGLIYVALQCALTLFLRTESNTTLMTRLALCFAATVCFVYHMLTVPDHFGGVSHQFYINDTEDVNTTGRLPFPPTLGIDLKLPIDTGGAYLTSAITEWLLVIFFCGFFFTFFQDIQQYSIQIVIETHRTGEEHQDLPEHRKFSVVRRISVSPEMVQTIPAPDARKYFRRDSTCQTMTDDDFVAKKSSANGNHVANGAKKPKSAKESLKLDAKLDAKLNKMFGAKEQTVRHSMSTDCGDLDKQLDSKRNGFKGQKAINEEAEKIEVLGEEDDVDNSKESSTLEGKNGELKNKGSEKISTLCSS